MGQGSSEQQTHNVLVTAELGNKTGGKLVEFRCQVKGCMTGQIVASPPAVADDILRLLVGGHAALVAGLDVHAHPAVAEPTQALLPVPT